ncbi:hypothetical protein WJX84_000602 [Apatococcus fuscideae]|uniref:Actin-related protein 6 n=1 Tax=Apatococcus fuscideae TaxID=2026836 RepID=A0AAW1TBL1_9CHLO
MSDRVVVLDNGGSTCKVGVNLKHQPHSVFPNGTGKIKGERQPLVGDQLLACGDLSTVSIRRPIDRGYLVNSELEREIWARAFRSVLKVDPNSSSLLLTEAPFALPAVEELTAQLVFEDFGFHSCLRVPAATLAQKAHCQDQPGIAANRAACGLVVDAGFSFTHVVPVFDAHAISSGIKRINIGGKLLTNYLKELVSYRSINMMEETYLMEHIKEQACFVSTDLRADLHISRARQSPNRREYVLPDGVNSTTGFLRIPADPLPGSSRQPTVHEKSSEQVLMMNNERFLVPEVLFSPGDLGLQQAGLAEAIVQALEGFAQRLLADLRPLVSDEYEVGVYMPDDPITCAHRGGALLAASPAFGQAAMTRQAYEEEGAARMQTIANDD